MNIKIYLLDDNKNKMEHDSFMIGKYFLRMNTAYIPDGFRKFHYTAVNNEHSTGSNKLNLNHGLSNK